MVTSLRTLDQYEDIIALSKENPVFLFKHSSTCEVSAGAWVHFNRFAQTTKAVSFWKVLVIEDRPISNHVESETGVRHESPQVLLFYDGQEVWNTSHWNIKEDTLEAALADVRSRKKLPEQYLRNS